MLWNIALIFCSKVSNISLAVLKNYILSLILLFLIEDYVKLPYNIQSIPSYCSPFNHLIIIYVLNITCTSLNTLSSIRISTNLFYIFCRSVETNYLNLPISSTYAFCYITIPTYIQVPVYDLNYTSKRLFAFSVNYITFHIGKIHNTQRPICMVSFPLWHEYNLLYSNTPIKISK